MATQAAQASTEMEAPPERVWKSLTSPQTLGSCFFGSKVETDWTVGGPILFRGEWQGRKFEDKGQVKAFTPLKQLSFTHWSPLAGTADTPENYHRVTFDLTPIGKRTRVTVTQENQDGKPVQPGARQELDKNWKSILNALKQAAESPP